MSVNEKRPPLYAQLDVTRPAFNDPPIPGDRAFHCGLKKSAKTIALAVHVAVPHVEGIVHGVVDYAKSHCNWRFALNLEAYAFPLDDVSDCDGAIAMIETEDQMRRAKSWGCPVINVADTLKGFGLPSVMNDNRKLGQMAAVHLKSRGLRHFAFYGLEHMWYSQERCAGFCEVIEASGAKCFVFESPICSRAVSTSQWQCSEFDEWLLRLPRPCGLMATHDFRAWAAIESCRRLGIAVPYEIAIVGVDDNTAICSSCSPPLTSVRPNSHQVGYRAAELLNKLLENQSKNTECLLIKPDRITVRGSTDTVAVNDPTLQKAVDYIHSNFYFQINVADVARTLGVSRRWLSFLFHEHFGITTQDYIAAIRVKWAKDLLLQTPFLALKDIGHRCGFASADRLNKVFTRITGSSPRSYRDSKLGRNVDAAG
ncbi:MAG: DNA-binding transcriptional regulator [Planctomycetota bacterium]|nr:DNA-binding transcriptional regulator [Planctomycetota bacterium]